MWCRYASGPRFLKMRGLAKVGEASLALNLEQRQGRATVEVAGPRFSGLQGRSLSGAFRWERDVVRLERAVLEQAASRCAAHKGLVRVEVHNRLVVPCSLTSCWERAALRIDR